MTVFRAAVVSAACTAAVLAGPVQALASPGYPPTGPTNGGGGVVSTTTEQVNAPASPTGAGGGSTLPFTGTEAASLVAVGTAALAIGGTALLAGRRRRPGG